MQPFIFGKETVLLPNLPIARLHFLTATMKALLGRKIGMSQVFSSTGEVVPVTVVEAKPNQITLRRQANRDGYTGYQLTLPKKGEKHVARREFEGEIEEGKSEVTVEQFTPGDVVTVIGTSKGKGFQGVVKRHKFKGGPASHGHTDWERRGGSIGQRFPQHTLKGKRMAGRMGADRVTVKNLEVVSVDVERHILAIKGAVPGYRGSVLEIVIR